ncbi:hypothetical protein [Phenylobacterium sp.]|uniref:hypothetical protein n=1 Tax=Phenylobacterium sp. TaxID=1871053 RepID=UPI002722D817|nr:hypothetical protein [Phenylobacterium sp.]MDO8377859.1 hypothetical protein [Phenylobacterium sp.]
MFPGQHFWFWGYAFSKKAWQAEGRYQRGLLLLFRIALLVDCCAVTLVFAVEVAAQLHGAT